MPRRVHVPAIRPGRIDLPPDQVHHLRHVLRLPQGQTIELFDDTGATAEATLLYPSPDHAQAQVDQIHRPDPTDLAPTLTIASAVPKAARADWMIEKLSELGVIRFIPLQTARSVVHPQGKSRYDRWKRIAVETSKQSHREGIMQIDSLTLLAQILDQLHFDRGVVASATTTSSESGIANPNSQILTLSPTEDATPILTLLQQPSPHHLTLFIGPEGGWTEEERTRFARAQARTIKLTNTILRTETAAIAAAAITAPWLHHPH